MEYFYQIISALPAELRVVLVAALPIAELRLALPYAVTVLHFSWLKAYFFSVLGNIIPVFFIAYGIEYISNQLSKRYAGWKRFFDWLFARTRKKFIAQYLKYGEIALVIFVGIPLPMTGAWTGALAAWLFGIKPKTSLLLNFLGVMLAGIIVLLLTFGVKGIL